MEVVGVVLGAIPIIITAMEYFPKAKELGKQIWRFRRERQNELRQVAFCKQLLNLHLQALLEMNSAEIERLWRNPADRIWKDMDVEHQMKQRLAGSFAAYSGILAIVEEQMARLMKSAKVDDEAFKDYLVSSVANPSDADDLKVRATAFLKRVAIQPRIGKHAFSHHDREEQLNKLEKSIQRLKELLEAEDGVSETNRTQRTVKKYKIPSTMQGFWNRAERIWHLIHEHLRCACKSKHCARLWFDTPMAQDSLSLVFLFDKAIPRTAEPWKRSRLKIQRSNTQCSCVDHLKWQNASVQNSPGTPTITVQLANASSLSSSDQNFRQNSATAASPGTSIMSSSGLCEALKHLETRNVLLGALCSVKDDHPYQFLSNEDNEPHDFVPLSSMLDVNARPPFYLRPRMKVAAMLALAHLRYFRTPWVPDCWKLQDTCFPKDPQDANKIQFEKPYILADFEEPTAVQKQYTSTMSQGFVTLGIVLLELCFGRPLETHQMWNNANGSLHPTDPFHRQHVAGEWAKEVDLMIDGPEYAQAVKWCLREAPTDDQDGKWREEFTMNVVGPLLKIVYLL